MFLNVENLGYAYRKRQVLHHLSFRLAPGATVLLGHNGAGKSTLFSLLSTAIPLQSGNITLTSKEQTIDSKKQRTQFRRHVALVPQHYIPVRGISVKEHIEYVSWLAGNTAEHAKHLSQSALKLTDLIGLQERKSHELSGGETQRLAIAGALATNAHILLLDEPTAGLDPAQKQAVNQLISHIAKKQPVLVATHDLYQMHTLYHNVIALSQGKIQFQGSTAQFLEPFGGTPEEQALTAFDHYMN